MSCLPTQIIPCCIAKTNIDCSVDCLSPEGSDDTVKPLASFPFRP